MKNLLIILYLFISIGNLQAQSDDFDGKIILGGYFNFTIQKKQLPFPGSGLGLTGASYSSSPSDGQNTSFTLSPILGKEFTQHWTAGIKFNYHNRIFKSEAATFFSSPLLVETKSIRDQFGTGLFARYTFNPERKFNFFIQPYFDINTTTDIYKVDNEITREDKINFLRIGTDGGVLYNLNNKFRVTANIAGVTFATGKWKDVVNDEMDNFMIFNSRFRVSSISLGLEFKL